MLKRNRVAALGLAAALCLVGGVALTQDRGPLGKDGERIAELVKQLGSPKFAEREMAKKELEAIGVPALEALKKAEKDENLETSKRATDLVRKIEDRLLTAELLTPKRLRLNVQDQPALDVIAELSRLSGYQIQVNGDRAAVAEKKITLDTGEVAFWEALDQVCAKAGLNEQLNVSPLMPPVFRPPVFRPPVIRPPIKIKALPVPLPRVAPGVLPVLPDAPPPAKEAPPKDINDGAVAFVADDGDRPVAKPAVEKPAVEKPAVEKPADKPVAGKGVAAPGIEAPAVPPPPPPPPPPPGGVAPGFPGIGGPPVVGTSAQIQLIAGAHKDVPTSYTGSVRIRALTGKNMPTGTSKGTGPTVVLDAAAEPRLQGFQLVGNPTILKAIDDEGQELAVSAEIAKVERPMGIRDDVMILPFPGPFGGGIKTRHQTVVFKKGEKASKLLKELSGTLTAQAVIPNEVLVKMDNVMDAAGKTVNAANGGSLTLDGIEKQADGSYKVKMKLDNLTPNPFGGMGGGIVINGAAVIEIGPGGAVIGGGPGGRGLPDLVDAKGNKLQFGGLTSMRTSVNGGQISQEATVVYRPAAGAGDPASLVLFGNRTVNFQVPFTFRDVPLE